MIALTTPTGNIGSKVLARLLEANKSAVRVLARDPAKLHASSREMEIVQGSMDNPADIHRLLEGADTLFWCQPDTPTAPDYLAAYEERARVGAAAVLNADVSHVVAISAAGEPEDTPAGPITALHRVENILAGTGAAMRFLRCGSFFENLIWQWDQILELGSFTYPAPGHVPGPQVATADIARVAADLLQANTWSGTESVPLLGPEDLTYNQIATHLSVVLGRPVRYEPTAPDDYANAMIELGQSANAAASLIEMFSFLARDYTTPPNSDRTLTPTSLLSWLNR